VTGYLSKVTTDYYRFETPIDLFKEPEVKSDLLKISFDDHWKITVEGF
jgi:hypothetical protein